MFPIFWVADLHLFTADNCEFDAVKLIWMTRTNREAPCQVELHLRAVRCAAIGSTWPTGPLSNAPFKTKCGTLGACILFPRKDIQLRRTMPLLARVN